MYVYVCMCMYMYVYVSMCMYMYVLCVYVCVRASMFACMPVDASGTALNCGRLWMIVELVAGDALTF